MQYFGFDRPSFGIKTYGFGANPDDAILALFAGGKQGVWYDPSDKSTLFQDVAGTVPVTKDGDPVGLMLDKSQGLALGEELMVNSNFNSDINGWTALYPLRATVSWDSGRLKLSNISGVSNGGQTARYTINTIIGKTYRISANLENTNLARLQVSNNNVQLAAWYAESVGVRDIQIIFTATSVNTNLDLDLAGSGMWGQGTIWLDNISVKELKGNHATQSVSTSRPIYKTDGLIHWLEFDGVDDRLGWENHDRGTSVAVACSSYGSANGVLGGGSNDLETGYIAVTPTGLRYRTNSTTTHVFTEAQAGTKVYSMLREDNGDVYAWRDGEESTNILNKTPIILKYISPGNVSAYKGRVYGVVVSENLITRQQRDELEIYLANKSGVSL